MQSTMVAQRPMVQISRSVRANIKSPSASEVRPAAPLHSRSRRRFAQTDVRWFCDACASDDATPKRASSSPPSVPNGPPCAKQSLQTRMVPAQNPRRPHWLTSIVTRPTIPSAMISPASRYSALAFEREMKEHGEDEPISGAPPAPITTPSFWSPWLGPRAPHHKGL